MITPGPWKAEVIEGQYLIRAEKIAIAKLYSKDQSLHKLRGPQDPHEDAQLIAAAPRLLEACALANKGLSKIAQLERGGATSITFNEIWDAFEQFLDSHKLAVEQVKR